jgi:hypothetical protein
MHKKDRNNKNDQIKRNKIQKNLVLCEYYYE